MRGKIRALILTIGDLQHLTQLDSDECGFPEIFDVAEYRCGIAISKFETTEVANPVNPE